jgi:hypothetical protein
MRSLWLKVFQRAGSALSACKPMHPVKRPDS